MTRPGATPSATTPTANPTARANHSDFKTDQNHKTGGEADGSPRPQTGHDGRESKGPNKARPEENKARPEEKARKGQSQDQARCQEKVPEENSETKND